MKNAITIFLAVVLSIFFVLFAVTTVISAALSAMVQPRSMVSLVQNVDYTQLLMEDDDFSQALEENGIDEELVEDIIKSDAVAEAVEIYADGISGIISGDGLAEGLTVDDIKDIVDNNIEEIAEIVNEYSSEEIEESELRINILTAIDQNEDEIAEALPTAQQMREEIDTESLEVMQAVLSPTVAIVLGGAALLVALLIFLCRRHNFKGFFWIGVDSVISFVLLGLFISSADGMLVSLITEGMTGGSAIVDAALEVFLGNVGLGIGALVILSILAFVAYFMLKTKILPDNHQYVEIGVYDK